MKVLLFVDEVQSLVGTEFVYIVCILKILFQFCCLYSAPHVCYRSHIKDTSHAAIK